MKIKDMPKLESPFEREEIKNKYVCVPQFKKEFDWILNPSLVIATEKFDGTNVSCIVKKGNIDRILNRTNQIDLWKFSPWFYNGIRKAIDEKKFKPQMLDDGQYFGELIGGRINGNPYNLDSALWLPFDYVKEHYAFRFYNEWLEDQVFKTDKDIFDSFSGLFQLLKSLYFRKQKIEKAPEGIVFYNKETEQMCKLRGDMFDWFEGKAHKWSKT